jgi:hypothetical protein
MIKKISIPPGSSIVTSELTAPRSIFLTVPSVDWVADLHFVLLSICFFQQFGVQLSKSGKKLLTDGSDSPALAPGCGRGCSKAQHLLATGDKIAGIAASRLTR